MTVYMGMPVAFLAPSEDWEDLALCKETGGDDFFPEKGESTKVAKAVCAKCEVTSECLGLALRIGARFGVWGGLSERERRQLAKRMGMAA